MASDLIESTLYCYANYTATGPMTGEVEIDVMVGADGRASAVTTPPGTIDRMAAAAQCVGVRLEYRPALKDGLPVAAKLALSVQFPSLPQVRGELQRVVDYCHAPWTAAEITLGTRVRNAAGLPVRGQQAQEMDARIGSSDSRALEGSVNLVARVGKDGKIKEYQLPGGVLPWMQDAVKCVADRLEFFPARLRTLPAESWTMLPLVFGLSDEQHLGAEIIPPSPRSEEATIVAIYRKCYPAGETEMATIAYRITVAKTGRVRRAELLESSGNAALDEAGACILRNLSFVAARRNGRAVDSTLNWPILVRPPG
ncbi:MAG: energy transducer TonB family protein [Gammaproteobacteria bacterium]